MGVPWSPYSEARRVRDADASFVPCSMSDEGFQAPANNKHMRPPGVTTLNELHVDSLDSSS